MLIDAQPMDDVRCRPRPLWLFRLLVGLLCIIAGCFWFLPNTGRDPLPPQTYHWLRYTFTSLCLFLAVTLHFWVSRAAICGGSRGLRWRGLGRWRSVLWTDVEDYYREIVHFGQRPEMRRVIKTRHGTIRIGRDWSNIPDLERLVQDRAREAQAKTWSLLGSRTDEEWSRTFSYGVLESGLSIVLLPILALGGSGALIERALSSVPQIATGGGWFLGILAAVVLGAFALLPCIAYGAMFLMYLNTWRRRRQRITVSAGGLLYDDGEREIRAGWSDVVECYTRKNKSWSALKGQYVVVTKQGTFDYLHTLRRVSVLTTIILENAPLESTARWRSMPQEEALGGPRLRWTGGQEGIGRRIYHYRNRTHRALLWFPTSIALVCLLLALLTHMGLTPESNPKPYLMVAAVLAAVSFWGWWRFYADKIIVDEECITQSTPWRQKTVTWGQVQDYGSGGDGERLYVQGAGRSLWFWKSIADVEELKDEIARRAVHSRRREWEAKEERAGVVN